LRFGFIGFIAGKIFGFAKIPAMADLKKEAMIFPWPRTWVRSFIARKIDFLAEAMFERTDIRRHFISWHRT
jgi:hypothetical protein